MSLTNLLYHLVFGTQDRHPWITREIEQNLYEYLGGIIRGQKGISLEINGVEDHLHILAKLHQATAVADVLRELKSESSRWLHENFAAARKFAWQPGYAAFTVSESQVERVRRYIRNQKQHHRSYDFRTELIALLEAHRIEFDEKYLLK